MDPFHQSQWRPPWQHLCPQCLHPHFPFCPLLPPPYYPYNNPHSYPHPPSPHLHPHLPLDAAIPHKRPRLDPPALLDDLRRLKLIRDHGFLNSDASRSCPQPRNYAPPVSLNIKSTVLNASHLFILPFRKSRPECIVVILRGLPGSGKSYTAKMMRELEIKNAGDAPRIHSIDDYFMTEIENGGRKNKSLEYCFEPEMEGAYRESMLKAFKRTLGDGVFKFVIVDDRNLRVADFAQFWVAAKGMGYEVYISEAAYKDPVGCAARNIHGFTLTEIEKMADEWEEAPSLYLQLDNKALFHCDDLKENAIQEVEMDAGDDEDVSKLTETVNNPDSRVHLLSAGTRKLSEEENNGEVKELGKSKWCDNMNEVVNEDSKAVVGSIKAEGKKQNSVTWSDKAAQSGFLIGAVMKKASSLVIGPGAGYNLKSNPLRLEDEEEENRLLRNGAFEERFRAERQAFRSVFEKRRHRIAGFVGGDEE